MYRRWPFRYGFAAVVAAVAIIALSLFANLSNTPLVPTIPTVEGATFAVMLTDPPTVPAGTTELNLAYTNIAVHVVYPDGTDEWLYVEAEGTVNLFSLIDRTKTLATITIPENSIVDKVQFTIEKVTAVINGELYDVTSLSDTFVIKVVNGVVDKPLSGVIIDFNPTLVQIQATDENDATVYYYVLVPSAKAIIASDLTSAHAKVGTIIEIGEHNRVRLTRVQEEFKKSVTIVSAKLTVDGDTTELSVTLKNEGDMAFRIFGLTLHGEFKAVQNLQIPTGHGWRMEHRIKSYPQTIPFRVNDNQLIPVYGAYWKPSGYVKPFSAVTINPGETVTLTFDDIIALYTGLRQDPLWTITPIAGNEYTIRLMGEGFQTYTVTATATQP